MKKKKQEEENKFNKSYTTRRKKLTDIDKQKSPTKEEKAILWDKNWKALPKIGICRDQKAIKNAMNEVNSNPSITILIEDGVEIILKKEKDRKKVCLEISTPNFDRTVYDGIREIFLTEKDGFIGSWERRKKPGLGAKKYDKKRQKIAAWLLLKIAKKDQSKINLTNLFNDGSQENVKLNASSRYIKEVYYSTVRPALIAQNRTLK